MIKNSESNNWSAVLCDSLEKIFPDQSPRPMNLDIPVVVFRGEEAGFQIAFKPPRLADPVQLGDIEFEITSPAGIAVSVQNVALVPVELPAFEDADEHYLRTTPGLFPDLLRPVTDHKVAAVAGQWRAVWIDVMADSEATGQSFDLLVQLISHTNDAAKTRETVAELAVPVKVVGASLPELAIDHSEWFHADSLADYYGVETFSEEHWKIIDNQLAAARKISCNTILTPTWTPPLDTAVGGERTPTQLIDIAERAPGRYEFDFQQLRRWTDLCKKHGFRNLEIAHLFTQWGAKATPAIYVTTADGSRDLAQRFGWDVPALDPSYRTFLEQLLPELRAFLDSQRGLDNVFFHISDEPTPDNQADYFKSREQVIDLLAGCKIIDAISDYGLFESGAVPLPIVSNDHADQFLAAGVPMWLYYCVAQEKKVANRFISLPSARSRVLGAQLFLTRVQGFLHWGFNFYGAFHSSRTIDPFTDTCAGNGFLGGDSFLVYPGPDGQVLESIRFKVLGEAMLDYRAMQALAQTVGAEKVDELIQRAHRITLSEFPYEADHYRAVLAQLATEIEATTNAALS